MKEYIKDLRKHVGHRPIIMCGACVIIINKDHEVLMLKRSDNNCWCFPGGALEPRESLQEAAKREVLEETGLNIIELELFNVYSGEELYYKYPNGDEVYNVVTAYISNSFLNEVKINNESKEARFFSIEDIPNEISPPDIPIVAELREKFTKLLN